MKAKSQREADAIFHEWYRKHISDPKDTVVYDLLDEGNKGIEVTRCPGKDDSLYNPEDIMLPEEKNEPWEPVYDLHIKFADEPTNVPAYRRDVKDITIADLTSLLFNYSQNGYVIYPDNTVAKGGIVMNDGKTSFYVRLVPKG